MTITAQEVKMGLEEIELSEVMNPHRGAAVGWNY